RDFFRPEEFQHSGDKRYSDKEIAYYYLRLKEETEKHGIRFNVCYIGNGEKDYYQYQKLWSNQRDCCDALGNVPAFARTSQDVPWSERRRHAISQCLLDRAIKQD